MDFTKEEIYHLVSSIRYNRTRRWDKTTDKRLLKLIDKLKSYESNTPI